VCCCRRSVRWRCVLAPLLFHSLWCCEFIYLLTHSYSFMLTLTHALTRILMYTHSYVYMRQYSHSCTLLHCLIYTHIVPHIHSLTHSLTHCIHCIHCCSLAFIYRLVIIHANGPWVSCCCCCWLCLYTFLSRATSSSIS